ncbi:hypothetical protein SLA2020_013330 [Shorea laevis]
MVFCFNCAKNVTGDRPFDGHLCCNQCGKVLEDFNFSEESQYYKDAAGFSRLAGNRVNCIRNELLSRQNTLERAREILTRIFNALNIDEYSQDVVNTAERFYEILLDRNKTRGRKLEHVLASCLYLACREKNKPFLLIDFSNHLSVNVYEIGAVYLQLCHELYLADNGNIQKLVDPSIFIHKFTNALLPEGSSEVVKTARDIIASMKRDWMQTGRKPSGLCGAALYISALSHGLKCSKSDIMRIVHICEATLTKRLIEFENTDAGSLTIEEFMEKEKDLQASSSMKQANTASSKNEVLCQHREQKPVAYGLCPECYDDFMKVSGGLEGGFDPPAFQRAEKERLAESSTEENANEVLRSQFFSKQEQAKGFDATTKQAALHEDANDEMPGIDCSAKVHDESDNFDDIDDLEVDGYLHNEEEKHYKKIIWEEMNREYLEEQAAKEAAAAAAAAANEAHMANNNSCPEGLHKAKDLAAAVAAALAKSKKEKQKRAAEAKNCAPAQTPAQATLRMLTRKRLSSKINQDALEKLFNESEAAEESKKQRTEMHSDMDNQDTEGKHQPDNPGPEDGYNDNDGEYEKFGNDLDFANTEEAYDYNDDDYGYDGF